MILANRSQTVVLCGIRVLEHGYIRAEFALYYPEAPKRLDLYQLPDSEDNPLFFGTYQLVEKPTTLAVMTGAILKPYTKEPV